MKRNQKRLITLLFDVKDELELDERDYDMFILEFEEGKYKEAILDTFVQKDYAWNEFNRAHGHKDVLGIEWVDLTNLKTYALNGDVDEKIY